MEREQEQNWTLSFIRKISPRTKTVFLSVLIFGLFSHGMGLFNKLSHQDDIANLFGFGATVTSGRWMLHLLCWMEDLFFGTGNASLPLFNGMVTFLCMACVCALLADLLKIRNRVYWVLMGCLLISFPMMAALFSYMFTSHPYMIGRVMMTLSAWLICRESPWWAKVCAVLLGAASVGVYQAYLSILLAVLLISDIMELRAEESIGSVLRRAGIQALCVAGVLLGYFAVNRLFLIKFGVEMTSYQGLDRMGVMSPGTFLERCAKAYRVFLSPDRETGADMYPGTLRLLYGLQLGMTGLLAVRRVFRTAKKSPGHGVLLALLFLLIPLGCNFIYVMSEEVHGLMVFGQAMQFVLLIALLDELDGSAFRGRQAVSLAASLVLAVTSVMFARFDNQCYLKETLQQQEAMSYYTTLITRIKSHEGYTPEMEICFVNDLTNPDPTIYDLEEMSFIRLNLYGHSTTEFIHSYKEYFIRRWNGFEANWYWGEDPEAWPEVQAMPAYPADGSIQTVNGVLIVKF